MTWVERIFIAVCIILAIVFSATFAVAQSCPDMNCDEGETCANCPEDCPATPCCGASGCESGEDCDNCPGDCPCGENEYCSMGNCECSYEWCANSGCCADGEVCNNSSYCCAPNANECGDDGCDGTHGDCQEGYSCVDGTCVCDPDCEGKECGDDGCSGSCGDCTPPDTCDETYQCSCTPNCDVNDCTDDGCTQYVGCYNTPNSAACDDADACTESDACSGGACGGTPVECNDVGCDCSEGYHCNAGICDADPSPTPSPAASPSPTPIPPEKYPRRTLLGVGADRRYDLLYEFLFRPQKRKCGSLIL